MLCHSHFYTISRTYQFYLLCLHPLTNAIVTIVYANRKESRLDEYKILSLLFPTLMMLDNRKQYRQLQQESALYFHDTDGHNHPATTATVISILL